MQIKAGDIAALIRTLSRTAGKKHFTSAVIAAAGSGTRMGGEKTKQLTELCGVPVIVRTLMAFERCPEIDEIIVAARSDETALYAEFREKYHISKLKEVVAGGETRQESVLKGFERISDKSEFVAIHDGARCLVTPEIISSVAKEAFNWGAATAASRVCDTVKRADFKGFVSETVDRSTLWLAGTPQIFKTELYRAAAYVAKEEGFAATDDNMLAEHIGYPVRLVDCGSDNIKITTPADLAVAEVILRRIGDVFRTEKDAENARRTY